MTRSRAPNLDGQSFGKWTISSLIGEGGFAWVYKGREPVLERDVAIKILQPLPEGGYLDETRERFLLEAKMTAHLRDQHTLSVYSVGEEQIDGETYLYFVSEYVDGPTLSDYLEQHGALNPLDLVIVLKQIAKSLHEAHTHEESPFIHRDLKCANVMISKSDSMRASGLFVKVVDYGIGKALRAGTSFDKNLTSQGEFNLSVFYAAPEQITSPDKLGAWTDLYALGIVAYECLTGEHPYEGKSQSFALAKVVADESITLPPEYQDGPLAPIITKLLQKKIEHRYQDCDELIADLNRLETKEDRLARKPPEPLQPEEPLGADTQGAPWISELLARQEFDETQTIRPNVFDPIEDKKTQTFQREEVSSPVRPVPRATDDGDVEGERAEQDSSPVRHPKVSPDSMSLEFESDRPTRPLTPSEPPAKMGKFMVAFLALVLLGGGISGAILMALETPSSETEAPYQTTSTDTEKPPLMVGGAPFDLVLTTKIATSRVSDAIKRARTDMKDPAALAAKEKFEEEAPVKQPRVKVSPRKATTPKIEKVTRKATKEAKSTSPPVTKEPARTSPAVVVKKDTHTTTAAPAPKETSSPAPPEKKEKEEYRFFGVP